MKKVLVITYYWPPSGGSGVQRWVKFAKYLPQEGWLPVVYTPEDPDLTARDETLEAEIPPEVEVIRRPIIEPYGLYRKFIGAPSEISPRASLGRDDNKEVLGRDDKKGQLGRDGKTEQPVTPISSGKKSFKERLSLWVRGNLFVPDPKILWVRPSVRFLKKYLREHPVDVIVTTGPPHSLHLIGEKLHKATGIPWIPDFRDPWSKMYYLKHLGMTGATWRKLKKQEKSVLDSATEVLTVTPFMARDFSEMTSTKVSVISNGYDESDFNTPAPEKDGYFNIVHTGLLASDGNPKELWRVLGEKCAEDKEFKEKMRLRLIGKVDADVLESIKEAGLEGNLVLLGYLDHQGAVREQRAASLLLLPLRNDPDYSVIYPGKLFEYLAAGAPIIGVGAPEGAMARVLIDTNRGRSYDWSDSAGLREAIDSAYAATESEGAHCESIDSAYAAPEADAGLAAVSKYSRRALTRALATLLDKAKNE